MDKKLFLLLPVALLLAFFARGVSAEQVVCQDYSGDGSGFVLCQGNTVKAGNGVKYTFDGRYSDYYCPAVAVAACDGGTNYPVYNEVGCVTGYTCVKKSVSPVVCPAIIYEPCKVGESKPLYSSGGCMTGYVCVNEPMLYSTIYESGGATIKGQFKLVAGETAEYNNAKLSLEKWSSSPLTSTVSISSIPSTTVQPTATAVPTASPEPTVTVVPTATTNPQKPACGDYSGDGTYLVCVNGVVKSSLGVKFTLAEVYTSKDGTAAANFLATTKDGISYKLTGLYATKSYEIAGSVLYIEYVYGGTADAVAYAKVTVKTASATPQPTATTVPVLKEEVKCVFQDSTQKQECWSTTGVSCTGTNDCTAVVAGEKGTKVTWKSSCGGYAYTEIDGVEEKAVFYCNPSVTPEPTVTVVPPKPGCSDYSGDGTYTLCVGNTLKAGNGVKFTLDSISKGGILKTGSRVETEASAETAVQSTSGGSGGGGSVLTGRYVATGSGSGGSGGSASGEGSTKSTTSSSSGSGSGGSSGTASQSTTGSGSGGSGSARILPIPGYYANFVVSVPNVGEGDKILPAVTFSKVTLAVGDSEVFGGAKIFVSSISDDYATVTVRSYPESGVSFYKKFLPGWNLFSVPVTDGSGYAKITESSCGSPTVWYYDAQNKAYGKAGSLSGGSSLAAANGFWVNVKSACEVTFSGNAKVPLPFKLFEGWNIVASPYDSVAFSSVSAGCDVRSGPWYYDSAGNKYYKSDSLVAGNAYFIKFGAGCSLELRDDNSPPQPPE